MRKRQQRGFTLLEALVATMIMGIAIAGIMDALAASARNVSRLTQADRAVVLARAKMDELLVNDALPRNAFVDGIFSSAEAGAINTGWRARVTPLEAAPGALDLNWVIDRVELEIWWMDGATRRSFSLEGYRRSLLPPGQGI
jgi:prepilin-type N-terminal cleavage/methylation domain-containing protein